MDEAAAAGRLQALEDLEQVAAAGRPAARLEGAAAGVEADGHRLAVAGAGLGDPLRVLQGGGADDHPGRAQLEQGVEVVGGANAPGGLDLDGPDGGDDAAQVLAVAGAAAEGGVEVDDVEPARALGGEAGGGLDRVAVAGRGPGDPLDQAGRLPVEQVDRREQLQGHAARTSETKLASRARPAAPDFSGWNWVPNRLPCSTAAAKRPP